MGKRKSTMVELVQELEKLPWSPDLAVIIAEAKAGEYHDYKNQKYVCGKVAVVSKLRAIGADDLAKQVMNGDYDEEMDEADKLEMRKTLIEMGIPENARKDLFDL